MPTPAEARRGRDTCRRPCPVDRGSEETNHRDRLCFTFVREGGKGNRELSMRAVLRAGRRRSRIEIMCRARLSLSLSEWGAASILVWERWLQDALKKLEAAPDSLRLTESRALHAGTM